MLTFDGGIAKRLFFWYNLFQILAVEPRDFKGVGPVLDFTLIFFVYFLSRRIAHVCYTWIATLGILHAYVVLSANEYQQCPHLRLSNF